MFSDTNTKINQREVSITQSILKVSMFKFEQSEKKKICKEIDKLIGKYLTAEIP